MITSPSWTAFSRSALIRLVLLVLSWCVVAATFGVIGVGSAAAATEPVIQSPTSAHSYSDPVWLPLRRPGVIHCVKADCSLMNGQTRGLDINAHLGDPVYAAGAGIAHIGGQPGPACAPGTESRNGNWVWVDHGGGVISRYHHLNTITIRNGQQVTPMTQLGTVGHSGEPGTCRAQYLHFEVRNDGLVGPRVTTPALAVCTDSGKRVLPGIYGTNNWDSFRVNRKATPAGTNACISGAWSRTPSRPQVTLTPANSAMTVAWGTPPAGTDKIMVRTERYSTALAGYGRPYHLTFSGAAPSTRLTGLTNGRAYKIAVSFHNAAGYSVWSAIKTSTPGAAPTASGSPRYLTWPHAKYVHYGWVRSNGNGTPVTHYEVAIRCSAGGTFGAWKLHMMPSTRDTYYNFQSLGNATTCQVEVHAKNQFGWGAWSKAYSVTT